ncbi:MAG: patatin-like phospholipase family protein [Acidobacteriota bacterium]
MEKDSRATGVALVLSAGFFGFFAHAGFLIALDELRIGYRAIAGSSAGALVAAFAAAGMQPRDIARLLVSLKKEDFWDPPGIFGIARAVLRRGRGWSGYLAGDRFEELVERHLPVKTFEQCARKLYITALNLTEGGDETFFEGPIAEKVRASCSYPFLFSTKRIGRSQYWDGGVTAKVPMEVMVERERPQLTIVHYLESASSEEPGEIMDRPLAPLKLVDRAMSIARREIEQSRRNAHDRLCQGSIRYITPELPRSGPDRLHLGAEIIERSREQAVRALSDCGRPGAACPASPG